MTRAEVLAKLQAQHATLRSMMARCVDLADALDAGHGSATDVLAAVADLRVMFEAHNRFEESVLRPILRDADAFGDVRIDHMIADHVDEHRTMYRRLGDGPTGELRATVASLQDHLAAEERYFLSPRVVRDDLVTVEGGG